MFIKKYTYLVNKVQENGAVSLVEVSYSEFAAIRNESADLPVEERRFFIYDYILADSTLDCVVMEAPREMYLEWLRDHIAHLRNRKAGSGYVHISLDACDDAQTENPLIAVASESDPESEACWNILLEGLRNSLSEWKPWASDMLALFETGVATSIPNILAEKLGVSPQTVRKYRKQFRVFVRNEIGG